jgi:DNA-directed RNA polymerase specialized sigma24 family protein
MSIIIKKKKYLSGKDLNYQMIVSKEQGRLTKEAQAMIILLAKNVIKKFYYVNPDDKLDCLQSAYLDIFANWSSFNPEKGEAFSWITEVVKRGMAKGWNKVHKTKGCDVDIISLSAYDSDGNSYDRF